ncbi:MAG: outer membrane beta-barrel protein [Pseudobdellovibrionaceae bacterium]
MTFSLLKAKTISAFFFITSALAINAAAEQSTMGLFLEPSVTYESSETSVNYPSPFSSSSGKADGLGLGARAGMHFYESFFLGLDVRYAMPQFKDSSVSYDAKSVSTNWGPVVGMQMPIVGLRVWGSYIFGGELNPEKSGSFDIKFQNAKGYRIGTGFRLAAVSLNLEYQQLKYDEVTLEQIGPFSSSSALNGVQLENKTWIAGVSFPIEI